MRVIFFILLVTSFTAKAQQAQQTFIPHKKYVSQKVSTDFTIDGKANETAWHTAQWSSSFVNINDNGETPHLDTRFKMLWDSLNLYVYVQMEEPHVWAKLKKRDTVIFYDNDIELFIDPNGDTHQYYEIEINAFNTLWDLLLTRPYRDKGVAINNWDINGGEFATHIEGTINDPSDQDDFWAVEMALPWSVLKELNTKGLKPKAGDVWRMNFSRVQWDTETVMGGYRKSINPETGKNLPEKNWVWSRQRAINMHEPEYWGEILFADGTNDLSGFTTDELAEARQFIYGIHRQQKLYKYNNGQSTEDKNKLSKTNTWRDGSPIEWAISLHGERQVISVKIPGSSEILYLDETGKNWTSK